MANYYLKCSVIFFSALFAVMGGALSVSGWLLKTKVDNEMMVPRGVGMVADFVSKLPVTNMAEQVTGVTNLSNVLIGVIILGCVIFCLAILGCCGVCTDSPRTVSAYGVLMAGVGLIQVGLVVVAIMKLQTIQQLNGMTQQEREIFAISLLALSIIMAVLMLISGCLACCLGSGIKKAEDLRQIAMMRLSGVPGVSANPYVRIETLPAHHA